MPMAYQLWFLIMIYRSTFTQPICKNMGIIGELACTGVMLFSQIALTLRIYAITMKNRIVIACCCLIMVLQFSLGMYLTIFTTTAAPHVVSVPIDAYRGCSFTGIEPALIAFVTLASVYDLFTFLVIVYAALRNNMYQFKILRLFRTIVQDATYYFLIIFTSHLLFEFILVFATRVVSLLPSIGIAVYLPVMVGRLMLSLKKAASSQGAPSWSFGEQAVVTGIRFTEPRGTVATGNEIRLDTLSRGHEGSQSRA